MSEVWVVSLEISRDNGTTIGVTRTMEQAKELAVTDWAKRADADGRPFGEWEHNRHWPDEWTADVSVLEYYKIQRFDLAD